MFALAFNARYYVPVIITVAGLKGGVAKTVTAVHVAAFLHGRYGGEGSTLLVDGDPNRSALDWAEDGGLPFPVVSELQAAKYSRNYEHVVLDTRGRPEPRYLEALVDGCDLLIIPSPPDALSLRVLLKTVRELKDLGREGGFKALLTIVPPLPNRDGERARALLGRLETPSFEGEVRRRQVFQKAGLRGVPVYEIKDPAAKAAWEDYQRIGHELVAELEAN